MRVIDPGHHFLLKVLDGGSSMALTFVKRVGPRYPGNAYAYSGTTSQEVLRALVSRAEYVNNQIPCWQTRVGALLMKAVIWLFEHRAARVHGRGLSLRLLPTIHQLPTCERCGHVQCAGH